MADGSEVQFIVKSHLGIVRLNRPHKLNALNRSMITKITNKLLVIAIFSLPSSSSTTWPFVKFVSSIHTSFRNYASVRQRLMQDDWEHRSGRTHHQSTQSCYAEQVVALFVPGGMWSPWLDRIKGEGWAERISGLLRQ